MRLRVLALGVLAILMALPVVMAQDPEGAKGEEKKSWSPFPELAELKRTNPKEYDQRFILLVLRAQMNLAKFGYGTRFTGELDAPTRSALREYQAFNHLPVTGDLNEATWLAIDRDNDATEPATRPFLPNFRFLGESGSPVVSATGLWIENSPDGFEKDSDPTTATIECYKDSAICREAYSMAHIPALDQYNITRWDDVEIVAESNGPCSRSTVTIAFAARTVIHTSASDSKPGCLWPNEKPRVEVVKLVDGMEWAMKHEQIDNAARRKIIRIPEAVRVKSGIFWSTESRPN